MQRANLLENAVYQFTMRDGGVVDFLDGSTTNRLLTIVHKGYSDNALYFNDEISGEWGAEIKITTKRFTSHGSGVIHIKFTPNGLEAWTDDQAIVFSRLTHERFHLIRFIRLFNSDITGGNPISGIRTEDAARSAIAERVLLRRIDALEQMIITKRLQ